MTLTETNYIETINGYSAARWQPLLDLIPEIENATDFGKMKGGEINEHEILMPYAVEASIISRFREVIYEIPVIVDFNWPEWEQGKEIVSDKHFDFDSIDIPTKCKIISAIARNDRFCDGVLLSAFQSGMMLKILKSIKGQIA